MLAPVAIATVAAILFTMGLFGSKKRTFTGKHAFISGGSEGIGRAIAEELLLQGASQITLLARSQGKLEQACSSLTRIISEKGLTASVGYQAADVTDWQQVRSPPPPPPCWSGHNVAPHCCTASPHELDRHEQVQKAVAAAEVAGGPINLLFCCAGTSTPGAHQRSVRYKLALSDCIRQPPIAQGCKQRLDQHVASSSAAWSIT